VHNGKLRVGIIGVGGIGRDQHLPGWAKVPFAEVTAAADLSEQALQRSCDFLPQARRFTDWRQLVAIEELDVVDICTPNRTHAPIALAALSAGKHVLCEKPLVTTAREAGDLAVASRKAGRLVMAGQNLRFDAGCQQYKALIDSGLLGHIYYARAQWLRRRLLPPRATFTERRLSGGGAALDIGVHVLDLAYWFMGAPEPVSVSAVADTRVAKRADVSSAWGEWDRSRLDVEDFAAGFVRFANGSVLVLETSWLSFQPEKELVRVQLFGDRAGLTWPDGLVVGETNRVPWELRPSEPPKVAPHHEEILRFAEAVRDGLPSPVPLAESLAVIRMLEAVYRSAELAKEVAVTSPLAASR
jgi:predicted dehydrogenase